MRPPRFLLLLPALLLASPLLAQAPPFLQPALDSIRVHNAWTLDQQASICEIPAPPFKEAARAAELKKRFTELGLAKVRMDEVGNVIGERTGRAKRPVVVLSAHMDTVFPESIDVRVRRSGTVMRGPGISDDCRGLAILLVVARSLKETAVITKGTIVFVGTVGEEGLGNSRGVQQLVTKTMPKGIDYFVTIDLNKFDVANRSVGSHRYQVTYSGPGGHSFEAFGMPNPIHTLGRAIAKIGDFQVPTNPKTTFNVGIVKGGTAVNAISASASMIVDLRSESAEELEKLDAAFKTALTSALDEELKHWPKSNVPVILAIDTLGIRPGGSVPDSSTILQAVGATAKTLSITPSYVGVSTDANVPIGLGIPAIALGHGGDASGEHSLSESYDDGGSGYLGPQWALLLGVTLAGQ